MLMRKLLFLTLLLQTATISAQDPGDQFFGAWTVHEIRFTFSQPGFWDRSDPELYAGSVHARYRCH